MDTSLSWLQGRNLQALSRRIGKGPRYLHNALQAWQTGEKEPLEKYLGFICQALCEEEGTLQLGEIHLSWLPKEGCFLLTDAARPEGVQVHVLDLKQYIQL